MDCARTNPKVKSCAEVLGNISLVLVDHRILMPASVQRRIPNYMSFSVASLARGQAAPGDWIAVVAAIPRSPPFSNANAAVTTAAPGPAPALRPLRYDIGRVLSREKPKTASQPVLPDAVPATTLR
jgi:hypothetical protein